MDRLEAALRQLTQAVSTLATIVADITKTPLIVKAAVHDLIREAEAILDGQLTLEEGDAPGPSAAIAASAAEDAAWRKLLAHLNACEERLAGKKLDDRTCAECHSLHAKHRATLAAFVDTTRQVAA